MTHSTVCASAIPAEDSRFVPSWELLCALEPRLQHLEAIARQGGGWRRFRQLKARLGRLCGPLARREAFRELRSAAAWTAACDRLEATLAEADRSIHAHRPRRSCLVAA